MFDKMFLNGSEEMDLRQLGCFPPSKIATLRDRHYQEAFRVDISNRESLVLKTRPYNSNVSLCSIELNPSKWHSWQEVLRGISLFVPPSSLSIDRLDHAVDRHVPISRVLEMLRVKYKRSKQPRKEWEDHSGEKITGAYFGKGREHLLVYDKAHQLKGSTFKPVTGEIAGVMTRFELRQKHEKIPFRRLSQIFEYLNFHPFENLEFYDLNGGLSRNEYACYSQRLEDKGMNSLYRELNKSRNFARKRDTLFKRIVYEEVLRENYRSNLRTFFGVLSEEASVNDKAPHSQDTKLVRNSVCGPGSASKVEQKWRQISKVDESRPGQAAGPQEAEPGVA